MTASGKSPREPRLRSPLRWAGGKSRLRDLIVGLIPPHSCYVEPFAGAAWVLFGKPQSDVEVLNDVDGEIVTFFRTLRDRYQELARSFEWELVSRAEFDRLAATDPTTLTDTQRAHRFYYLIMAGWGGEAAHPRFQTSRKDAGHGNRLIGALATLSQRLQPVHQRLQSVIIEHLDWRDCVRRYDSPDTVMYLDPPYPGNGVNYRFNMKGQEEHLELALVLKESKCSWILSSYDTARVRELFRDYHVTTVSAASGMRAGPDQRGRGQYRTTNSEVLITNFTPGEARDQQPTTDP